MAACDSAGTWPPPPSPGLETWRAGTKMAAPPNFHCYFGHSSSYFLGTRLPPCDGSSGSNTGTRLRHGGGRAEGERESEGREGRVKGMGGRKPRRKKVGRVEVRGGEGTGRRKRGRREGAGGRAGEEAERTSAAAEAAEASRGRPPGPGSERRLRRPRLPRAEPAGTSAVRRPRRRPGGGGSGGGGRWVAAETAG